MRRFIIILSILLLVSNLNHTIASCIVPSKDSMFVSANANQSVIKAHNDVYNNTSSSVTYSWDIISNSLPTGWQPSICDKSYCYADLSQTHEFTLASYESGRIDVNISPNSISGSGFVKIRIYQKGVNPNEGVIITVYVDASATSINEQLPPTFVTYPNPVKDFLNINFSRKGRNTIEIYNILGRKLITQVTDNSDFMRISLSSLQNGVYVVMYKTDNNKSITRMISKE